LRGIGGLSGEGWLDEGKVSNVGSATSFHGKLSGFVSRHLSKNINNDISKEVANKTL
jgi:hypothetical protein